jgi:hypothetical protein
VPLKKFFLLSLVGIMAWPQGVEASDHEVPLAVMHGPRGQKQQGSVSGYQWHPLSPEGSLEPCPTGPFHGDVFEPPPSPPIRVRPGTAMFIRFHKEDQPSSSDPSDPEPVEIGGARGPIPFTLVPHARDGQVVAWDARFKAPQLGRKPYVFGAMAQWIDEHCDGFTQWVAWRFNVQKRRPR